MRKRLWITIISTLVLLLVSFSALLAQRPRNRPAAPAAATRTDLKITYRTTTSGQAMENTTMLKGARERTEMKLGYGRDIINVTQCDLKRTIQISDSAKKYVITPMETTEAPASPSMNAGGSMGPSRKGGVVTYSTTAVDTGERKEMFGFQARHVKSSMTIESSPDACNPLKMRMETDGWYIDFSYGLNCETSHAPMGGPPARGGCRDTVRFNRQGAARTGYALQETITSYGPDGSVQFSSTKEVIELSREPLDAALFDVPAGYTEAASTSELYGAPSAASMMSQAAKAAQDDEPDSSSQSSSAQSSSVKAPGVIRIGVVRINNKSRSLCFDGQPARTTRQRDPGKWSGSSKSERHFAARSRRRSQGQAVRLYSLHGFNGDEDVGREITRRIVGSGNRRGFGQHGQDRSESGVQALRRE